MKKKISFYIKQFFAIAALSMFIMIPAVQITAASSFDTAICTPDPANPANNVPRCINNIYIFAVALGGFVSVLMFVIAGYLYISGTNESISEAKSIIQSTIAALIILFGTYILLNTINPDLTTIPSPSIMDVSCTNNNSNTAQLNCTLGSSGNGGGGNNGGGNNGGGGSGTGGGSCTFCVSLAAYGVPEKGSWLATPGLAQKLQNVSIVNSSGWYVTAAYDTSAIHTGSCHTIGNCADIGFSGATSSQIVTLCKDLKGVGLSIYNEFSSDSSVQAACGTYVLGHQTGPNLHVTDPTM